MIEKLRRKITLLSSVVVFLSLFSIIAVVNMINYNNVVAEADKVLSFLSDNRGRFPVMEGEKPEGGRVPDGTEMQPPPNMSPELPYESRYFTVTIDESGEATSVNTEHIYAVDEDMARSYAALVYNVTDRRGFADNYRYHKSPDGDGTRIVFLDCGRRLEPFYTFLYTSVIIALAGFAVLALVIYFFAGRMVRPIKEGYNRQKRFITDAGHEIKTPISIISANVALLESELGDNECLADIAAQTSRLASLTEELVYLARMEEGRGSIMVEFPLSEVVEDAATPFRHLAEGSGRRLKLAIKDTLSVVGDSGAVEKLVGIFLDNAIKYSSCESEILLSLNEEGRAVVLSVENQIDPARGIDPAHLFERFWRADSSRTGTRGYGIGLSIAKAIADSHGAKISADVVGARFTIKVAFGKQG